MVGNENTGKLKERIFMKQGKLTLVNCIATSLLAYLFTISIHELTHVVTFLAYGEKISFFSCTMVDYAGILNYQALSPFSRILVCGGSASILNLIIGLILVCILLKRQLKPTLRVFITQLMGAQLTAAFGYFALDALFGAGDWGNVFINLADCPGLVSVLRIILGILGIGGLVFLFFILNHMSYYFIEDQTDQKQRMHVALNLHLVMFILSVILYTASTMLNPRINNPMTLVIGFCMWIPFFWGFMFTGVMKVLPPKMSRFLYPLPEKPNWILLTISVVLTLAYIIVFGPGVSFG